LFGWTGFTTVEAFGWWMVPLNTEGAEVSEDAEKWWMD
jgi:hypothetical protein